METIIYTNNGETKEAIIITADTDIAALLAPYANNDEVECPKCGGRGNFPEFAGIWNGDCFRCEGKGTVARKAVRKSKADPAKESARKAYEAEQNRKTDAAMIRYANDPRLTVSTSHPYYYQHATQMAKADGVWDSL